MQFFATVPFAMEKSVKVELEKLGICVDSVENGKVFFSGTQKELAKALVNLRCADRIYLLIAAFTATDFDTLFDNICKLPWHEYVSQNGKINISATCARSKLMSVPDTQRIAKKAIVKAMQRKFKTLPETAEDYPIDIHINNNNVVVALDTCGEGLHKRGYRVKNAVAPIRETFASGLINVAGYRRRTAFCDPFCGSGTLVIEAAMYALNIAPGLNRSFACEHFKWFDADIIKNEKENAQRNILDVPVEIYGSDISPDMVEMTRFHAQRAGVDKHIKLSCCTASESYPHSQTGIIVTNPPYGERIGDREYMQKICNEVHILCKNYAAWQKYFLSGYKNFEQQVHIKNAKTRRYYNGNIECNFIMFPPKNS